MAHSWHTQSELDTFTAQQHRKSSRLLRNDLPVLPDVKRRAIPARGLARILCRTTQGASDARSKALGSTYLSLRLRLHGLFSKSCGLRPELSYTAQLSARGLNIRSKFSQLLENLRTTSRRGTS